MKILLVITKAEIGGAQNVVLNLARGLKENNNEVVVAAGDGNYLPEELKKIDIKFKRLNKLKRGNNPFKNLSFISELKNYVISEKFDVVHFNSSNTLLGVWGLAKLKSRPRLIFTVHGLSLLDNRYQVFAPLKLIYRLFFRLAFKKLDQIVFVSRLNLDFAKTSGLLRGLENKSTLIYNGVSFPPDYLLSREEARQILKLNPEDYVYGSIGRLAYPKNYEFLINTFKAVKNIEPKARLLIIGEGPERIKYENLIKSYKLEDRIILSGEIKQASRYLKAFDLFVLPSIFEGLSISLIEAVSAKVPAISSRVGGNEEIVGVENCFEVNDKEEFLNKLKGENQAIINNKLFSDINMVKKYQDIYEV